MSISEEVKGVIESQLADDEFIVDVILKGVVGTQKLIILVDSDDGMTIDRCSKISRFISNYLEENELFKTAFTLEVSSPGLDHPLKLVRQYFKNIGRGLKIRTREGRELEGILRGQNNDKIEIELRKNKKEKSIEKIEIPIDNIEKAMVLVSFNKQG